MTRPIPTDSSDAVTLWREFCETLRETGEAALTTATIDDEVTRAEGVRYLSRIARAALEWYVEFNDPEFPVFYKPSHETIKIGADNPDNLYLKAVIDGRYDYVISGHRGSVDYLSFASSKGSYAKNFKQIETGFIDSKDLQIDGQGRFEIIVSQTPQDGNWLAIDEASESILIRQTFLNRAQETPAELQIARRDRGVSPATLSMAQARAQFQTASNFYRNTITLFADWSRQMFEQPNVLQPWDQAFCHSVGGDPNIFYYHGAFQIADDEALVIHVPEIPVCQTWNIQIDNYWMESLDYRYERISVNRHTAQANDDGSVTLVLSHQPFNHPNRLSTAGHETGTLSFRWVGAEQIIHPQAQLVKIADLEEALT